MIGFAIFGAVGFGIGGALTRPISMVLPGMVALPLMILIAGAVGGASLGLATKGRRRILILALLGALGLTVGIMTSLTLGSLINYSEVAIAAFVGAMVGAFLGAASLDWRTILVLAVAGALGFSIGPLAGDFLKSSIPILRQVGVVGSITVAGVVGGASLGAALGYLENRKLLAEQTPRVR